MQLDLSESDEEFAAEVRAFICDNFSPYEKRVNALTPGVFADPAFGITWQRKLFRRGWGAPGWPVAFGGPDWTPLQRWIFESELAKSGCPNVTVMGLKMVGPIIMKFGNEEQKRTFLPRICSGEDYWCQGYSEPNAGSDLAALKTRAIRSGDHYVVNGTKIWTTDAHHANWMFALVKTEASASKQGGISFLLIDMKSPGITIRPIITLGGDHDINQVFLDDVRVPISNLIGEEGAGWTYGKYLLQHERGGGILAPRLRQDLENVMVLARSRNPGGETDLLGLNTAFAKAEIEVDILEMLELRCLLDNQAINSLGAISSVVKLYASETRQLIKRLAVDVIGTDALRFESSRPLYEHSCENDLADAFLPIVPEYLNSRAYTIFGGSAEIQLEIIAKQMLGLKN